mgnify:CR=1 FL=1|tara:strand:- start:49831 stop:51258 length:1428 start_codon:yes stop_codon:yes gene_type:complete
MATTNDKESFRDHIGTITEEGKRKWIYPKKPSGRFYKYRTYVSYILLAFLFLGPHLHKIFGLDHPLFLFDVINRKFILFGQVFWPQDFHLFAFIMITMIIFIVLFTVVFGRIFCGWVCPQTIFMEMVFRKIEYWIDGDYKQQMKLAKQEWNAEKIKKRVLKHSIFWIVSFIIANTFLAYIIGADKLWEIQTDNPKNHIGGLITLIAFTTVFYFIFSWFREQVCIIACPYGRLQGVMIDRNTIVVAYDYKRGEPRGKFRKNEDRKAAGKGDCIDCKQCVDVCPTGIDIRNGTQLECINCTACIDACDFMMEKVGLPKGLIRYDSEAHIAEGKKSLLTTRVKGYIAVLIALIGIIVYLFTLRGDVEATILRAPGSLYTQVDDNHISNIYTFNVVNKSNEPIDVHYELVEPKGELKLTGQDKIHLEVGEEKSGSFLIILDKKDVTKHKLPVKVNVVSNGKVEETLTVTFLGPFGNEFK